MHLHLCWWYLEMNKTWWIFDNMWKWKKKKKRDATHRSVLSELWVSIYGYLGESWLWYDKPLLCIEKISPVIANSLYFSDPLGFCDPQEETISGMVAWWGVNSSQPTSLTQCRLEDMPAGLHWLKFRYPPDWNQPDQVGNGGSVNLKLRT